MFFEVSVLPKWFYKRGKKRLTPVASVNDLFHILPQPSQSLWRMQPLVTVEGNRPGFRNCSFGCVRLRGTHTGADTSTLLLS